MDEKNLKIDPAPSKLQVNSLVKFEENNVENYINFVKRTGGQIFQHYSLSLSETVSSTAYRETEIIFSREVYKKHVYSSVILPLYSEDKSKTNSTSVSGNTAYFRQRVNPSYFERHLNSFKNLSGELRNIYKKNVTPPEGVLNNGISTITGELRQYGLPLSLFIRDIDKVKTTKFSTVGGLFKKVLLKAQSPIESVKVGKIVTTSLIKSTSNSYDTMELNFQDKNYLDESSKTSSITLDEYASIIDEEESSLSLRLLNKYAGIKTTIGDASTSISPYYDFTLKLDFSIKDLTSYGYLLNYSDIINVSTDKQDPSSLVVSVGTDKIKTDPQTILTNVKYSLVIERSGGKINIYLNNQLLSGNRAISLPTIFKIGDVLYIGNSSARNEGILGNIYKVSYTKRTAIVSEDKGPEYFNIRPIVASELILDGTEIKDINPNIKWEPISKPSVNLVSNGLVFTEYQTLQTKEVNDLNIYSFNNFKIEIDFKSSSLPTLVDNYRILIHKTGSLNSTTVDESRGYYVGLIFLDDKTKVVVKIGNNTLYSTNSIDLNVKYKLEVYKYKNVLLLFIDGEFDSLLELKNSIEEDPGSPLYIGKYQGNANYNFKGEIYYYKFINYYKDINNFLTKYLPKNMSYTSILNFDNNLLDEGYKKRLWTVSDAEAYSDISGKFAQYIALDDTNKYITTSKDPAFNLGVGDFTIEMWIKPSQYRSDSILLSNGSTVGSSNSKNYRYIKLNSSGKLVFGGDKNNLGIANNDLLVSSQTVPLNAWSHFALVRRNGLFSFYLNGNKVAESILNNVTVDFSVNNTYIGNNLYIKNTTSQFVGSIDSFRLIKSKATYDGSIYTVPTIRFGSVDVNLLANLGFDNQYKDVSQNELILNFEGYKEQTSLNYLVVNPKVLEETKSTETVIFNFNNNLDNSGNFVQTYSKPEGQTYNTLAKFGGYSANSRYRMSVINEPDPSKNIFIFGEKDFTIDVWIYETSEPSAWWKIIDSNNPSPSGDHSYDGDQVGMIFGYVRGDNILHSGLGEGNIPIANARSYLPFNTWNHLALTCENNVLRIFINGKKLGETVLSKPYKRYNPKYGLVLMGSGWASSEYLRGSIDALRVTRGKALFTTDFDVSDLKEPSSLDLVDTTFIETNNTLYSNKSIGFDVDKAVTFKSGAFFNINSQEDFTIELYTLFKENTDKLQTILSVPGNSQVPENLILLARDRSNNLILTKDSTLEQIILKSSIKLVNGQWYNIALTRYNGVLRLFINGIKQSEILNNDFSINFVDGFRLGSSIIEDSFLNGFIESLRIIKGLALYQNSYTPEGIYYTKENSLYYKIDRNYSKIYDEASGKVVTTITNSNTKLEEGFLKTKYPSDTSKTGILVPKTSSSVFTNFHLNDFTIEFKVKPMFDIWCPIFNFTANNNYTYCGIEPSFVGSNKNNAFTLVMGAKSFSTPQGSIDRNNWSTIAITKFGTLISIYINGVRQLTAEYTDTTSFNFDSYGDGIYIGGSASRSEVLIDWFYILKGQALYSQSNYDLTISPRYNKTFSTEIQILKSDNGNLIPENTFIENVSTDSSSKVVTSLNSVFKSSAYFNSKCYLKLSPIIDIPKDTIFEFWLNPELNDNATLVNLKSTSNPSSIVIKLIGTDLKVDITNPNSSLFSNTLPSLVNNYEWSCLKIIFKQGTLSVYINGTLVKEFVHTNPEFFATTAGTLLIGENYKGYIDNFIYRKYVESNVITKYYKPLLELFKVGVNYQTLPIVNNLPLNLNGWESRGETELKVFEDRNYFSSENKTDIYQDISILTYLYPHSKNVYMSWEQIGAGNVSLLFLDENKNVIKESKNISTKTLTGNYCERYILEQIQPNTKYIRVNLSLLPGGLITNPTLYTDNLGKYFYDKLLDKPIEYIPENSILDGSEYYYEYVTVNNDINLFTKETLYTVSGAKEITSKNPENMLIKNIVLNIRN